MKKLIISFAMLTAGFTYVHALQANPNTGEVVWQQETRTEIEKNKLPQAVVTTLEEKYADWDVDAVYKVTKPDLTVYYTVDISTGEKTKSVNFDADGKVIG